jgi:hypothetical protein
MMRLTTPGKMSSAFCSGSGSAFGAPNILAAVAETVRKHPSHIILEDATSQTLTYRRLMIPKLGTGKVDLRELQALMESPANPPTPSGK